MPEKACAAAGVVRDFFADTQMPCEACRRAEEERITELLLIPICESCGAELQKHPVVQRLEARVRELERKL